MTQSSRSLGAELALLMTRELDACIREIQLFPDDRAVWDVVPGVTNSTGNLALHLCGNLRHFVGACLGHTGYVRDRESEFAARSGSRDALAAELRATIEMLNVVLPGLDDSTLDRAMPGAPNGLVTSTRLFLLHLVAHTAFHLGQMGYLRRAQAGDGASSAGTLPLSVLAS